MELDEKFNYWFRKYFIVFLVGLIIIFGIIDLCDRGYNHLATALFCFAAGAVCLYQSMKVQNAVDHSMAVIIIGCDSGLGYSLALHCRSLGFTVIASVLDKNSSNIEEMSKFGIHIYELDITLEESVKNFGATVRECLKKDNLNLYALVNNAGLMIVGDFEWQTDEQMMRQINVNVTGTMRITKEILPLLRADKGRIIFISSHCTIESLPGFSIYGGTKSAIRSWATGLRVELKNQGIKVICFAPGSFFLQSNIMSRQMEYFTEMKKSMKTDVWNFHNDHFNKTEQYFKNIASYIKPEKISNSVIYKTFEDTLLDKYPSVFYECCPWRYTYYHSLCKIVPTCIRDLLIKKFTKIPR